MMTTAAVRERNPVLRDASVCTRFAALSPEAQAGLEDFLRWLYRHARENADLSWRRSKAPMAVYWKAVAAWSIHLARVIRSVRRARG